MNNKIPLLLSLLVAAGLAGCGSEPPTSTVSFSQEVKPILEQNCSDCHQSGGKGAEKSGLVLADHAAIMDGTRLGPVVQPGSAISSTLYLAVAGKTHPAIQMPHGKQKLSEQQVATIETWIDQGARNN